MRRDIDKIEHAANARAKDSHNIHEGVFGAMGWKVSGGCFFRLWRPSLREDSQGLEAIATLKCL